MPPAPTAVESFGVELVSICVLGPVRVLVLPSVVEGSTGDETAPLEAITYSSTVWFN